MILAISALAFCVLLQPGDAFYRLRTVSNSKVARADLAAAPSRAQVSLSTAGSAATEVASQVLKEGKEPPTKKTTNQSWFEKMGGAVASLVGGIVLVFFSIPVMWLNERQAARQESLIKVGRSECSEIGADNVGTETRGTLVHVSGADAKGMTSMEDPHFQAFRFEDSCLRMRSVVEAYQWVEEEHTTEKKDNVGGGTTKETSYTYTRRWSQSLVSSTQFKDGSHRNNLALPGFSLGTHESTCSLVHYGKAFVLPAELVSQIASFQDARAVVGDSVACGGHGSFARSGDYYYYPVAKGGGEPEVGDLRARLEYVPDGPATILALQSESADGQRDTFLPYRSISRGLWGIDVEEKKSRLLMEGKKSAEQLSKDDECSCGPLDAVFCCCLFIWNSVSYCFSGIATPEVYHLFCGEVSVNSCWDKIAASANMQKWCLRAVGWAMLLGGTMCIFQPLFTFFDIVPFLGPHLSNFLWVAVFIVAFIVTLATASLVISMAYLVYRPLIGVLYLLLTLAIVAVPIIISRVMNSKAA